MSNRKLSRVSYNVDARVRHCGEEYEGTVRNLSLSGMFIDIPSEVAIGDTVDVTLSLVGTDNDMTVDLIAEVTRTEVKGIAVRFRDIPLNSHGILKNIVVYNTGQPDVVDAEYQRYIRQNIEKERKNPS